jgi:hypothetical protein
MSPVSEGIQFKENSPDEGLSERHKGTEGRGVLGELGVSFIFWRRLQGKGVILENMICALWGWPWEKKTSGMCHINSVNTFPGAVLKS